MHKIYSQMKFVAILVECCGNKLQMNCLYVAIFSLSVSNQERQRKATKLLTQKKNNNKCWPYKRVIIPMDLTKNAKT